MIKNYFKLALRTFWNNKGITSINVFGLSFGIACAAIAFLFIQRELSFDKFHEESENIHFFYVNIEDRFNVSGTTGPFAQSLLDNFPEVTEGIRMHDQTILSRIARLRSHFSNLPNIHSINNRFYSYFSTNRIGIANLPV